LSLFDIHLFAHPQRFNDIIPHLLPFDIRVMLLCLVVLGIDLGEVLGQFLFLS
jgi:hypothetical protein